MLDAVCSLDSVITAVGMVDQLSIMVVAVMLAIAFMLVFAGRMSAFVDRHPTGKMLAYSCLLLIDMTLAERLDQHIPKGYIYFAMAISVFVEFLQVWLPRPKGLPVRLHEPYVAPGGAAAPKAMAGGTVQ